MSSIEEITTYMDSALAHMEVVRQALMCAGIRWHHDLADAKHDMEKAFRALGFVEYELEDKEFLQRDFDNLENEKLEIEGELNAVLQENGVLESEIEDLRRIIDGA